MTISTTLTMLLVASSLLNMDLVASALMYTRTPCNSLQDHENQDINNCSLANKLHLSTGDVLSPQVDPLMAQRMATWVAWGVINWQRRMDEYLSAQRACLWDPHIEGRSNRDNCDVRVGVMGFGEHLEM